MIGGRCIDVDPVRIRPMIDLISLHRGAEVAAMSIAPRPSRTSSCRLDIDRRHRQHRAVQEPKVSAVILDFVEPLFFTTGGPPPDKFEQILRLAVFVWNAVITDDHDGTDFLSQARAHLQPIENPRERQLMLGLVDHFEARKRREFAQHQWIVGHYEILENECRLRVDARLLPPRT